MILGIPVSRAQDSCVLHLKVWCADTDKLDHLYLATEQNDVIKFDANCRELYRYTNNYLGYPARIDAANPINVICYYPALQVVVTLDVTMNEISRTNLIELGFIDVRAVCSSNDGNLWILDAMDFTLKKINRLGRVIAQSENLILKLGKLPEISYMQELNNRVYLLEKNQAIYQFDNFGNFKTTDILPGVKGFHATPGQLFFWNEERWEVRQIQGGALRTLGQLESDQVLLLMHRRQGRQWLVRPEKQLIINRSN